VLPYDEQGSGPPVLLLHAGVGDRSMWSEHLGWLADSGHRAIAVDLPGFGEAIIADGPQAPWEDVLVTLRELGATEATLIGNSFGAAVALRVAVVAPVAVSGLVLISPPPLDAEPSPALSAAWDAETEALERGDVEAAVDAVIEAWLAPDAPAALRERVAKMQRRAIELQLAAPAADEAPDPVEQDPEAVGGLEMPVLAAWGEADMPDFATGATEIAGLVRHGRAEMIPGAGHLAPLEAPEAFRMLVLEFLGEA
jgi:pimeloyl-ACP methyl ester carboxylesterase